MNKGDQGRELEWEMKGVVAGARLTKGVCRPIVVQASALQYCRVHYQIVSHLPYPLAVLTAFLHGFHFAFCRNVCVYAFI